MLQFITVLLATAILSGCSLFSLNGIQPLVLDTSPDVELLVYRQVEKDGQKVMSPVGLVRGGQSMPLEPGEYLVANECSGYKFKQTKDKPTKIPVRRLSMVLHGERTNQSAETPASISQPSSSPSAETVTATEAAATQAAATQAVATEAAATEAAATEAVATVHTLCLDPLDGQRNEWKNRREFDILPGTTEFRIGGRLFKLENHGENSDKVTLDLYPVTIVSAFPENDARFYLTPEEKDPKSESSVVGMSANGSTWLLPGDYSVEVNGTRRKLSIERGALTEISVGVLRVEMPKNFPMEERLKAGGQPVFVYLDTAALLNMDNDYLVFPGTYTVSIEGSEVQDNFVVEAGQRTLVNTFAARVDVPPCPANLKSCRNPPGITIHREQKPYALMTVEPRLPFILLEGAYEYGVEGLRGIKRNLQRRGEALAGEPLARVKIKWDVRQAQGRFRTDLVRIESRGTNVFGRSLDLLFHKPEEVYVPAGSYDLTYFLGDPLAERVKTRQPLLLEPGQTREVVVPIYMEKVNRPDEAPSTGIVRGAALGEGPSGKKGGVSGGADPANTPAAQQLPQSLTPLRR